MDKNKDKLSKFAVILSRLRKERGISQKKAATDLGISQALLSHYEKGIRECGLDFVIRCGAYYGVTTDYLLGVSESRNGMEAQAFTVTDGDGAQRDMAALVGATGELLSVAAASLQDNRERSLLYDYYMLSLYRGAQSLSRAGALPRELFGLDVAAGRELAAAAIALQDARFAMAEDKSRSGADFSEETALAGIIREAEAHIRQNIIEK